MVKLNDLGEKKALKIIGKFISSCSFSVLPFYDDTVALKYKGFYVVANIDGFSIKYSKYYWMDMYDVGWKASTASISDVVVKGIKPWFLIASIGLRRKRSTKVLKDLIRGLKDSAEHHGSYYLGGDLNEGRDEWIDVATVGLAYEHPIPRKNIKGINEGDLVLTLGTYGLSGAASHAHYNKVNIKSWNKIAYFTKRPKVNLEFLNILTELRRYVLASEDVSDGLALTLWELAEINNIGFVINNVPIDDEALEYAKTYNLDPLELAFYGGEEYSPVFIVSSKAENVVHKLIKTSYPQLTILGKAISLKKVLMKVRERKIELKKRGWEYFKDRENLAT